MTLQDRLLQSLETQKFVGHWSIDLLEDRIMWSPRTAQLHGKPAGWAPDSTESAIGFFVEEDRERVRSAVGAAASDGHPFSFSGRLRRENGEALPVLVNGDCGVHDGQTVALWGFIEDASETVARDRMARDAVRAKDVLRDALEEMVDAFALFDPEDRLVLCNRPYRELYAISAPAIRPGAKFEDILRYGLAHGQYPAAIGREEEWLATWIAMHRYPPVEPIEQRIAEGRWLRVRETVTAEGYRVGFRADITEQKMMERKLGAALLEARASKQMHASLLPNLTHEMRTPLNAVIGFAQMISHMLKSGADNDKIVEYARDIEGSGRHLLSMVNRLMDLRDDESERRDGDAGISVRRAIERACRMAAYAARQRNKMLHVNGTTADVLVEGDETRLVQVLLNLLTNAIKYSPPGGMVEIRVDGNDARCVTLSVIDDGAGIGEDCLDRLFERYDRLAADASSQAGSGLGLSIAREFTESMGGRIAVENMPGRGAAFSVILPRAAVASEPEYLARAAG